MKTPKRCSLQTLGFTISMAFLCLGLFNIGCLSAQEPRVKAGAATDSTAAAARSKMATRESPFYCRIEKTLTKAEREHKKRLSQKMIAAQLETSELADGYAFKFRPNGLTLSELADWSTTESRCCPFFDLEIGVEREGGPLFLRVKGREGVKQFIRAEFKRLKVP